MPMGGRICPLCGCHNQPSVCPTCINHMAQERQRVLKRLALTRVRLRERLDSQLEQRRGSDEQRLWRREQGERLERLKASLGKAKAGLSNERSWLEERQSQLSASSVELAQAHSQLLAKKAELLGQYYPDLLRIKSLGWAKLGADLAHERRSILKQLCSIFPLRQGAVVDVPEAWDGAEKLTPAVRICGVRLPEGEDPLAVPAPELSASLGYLLQFLALAAKYLSAPLLHSAGFAASSSRIWQRASYWNPRAASASQQAPLFLPRPGSSAASFSEPPSSDADLGSSPPSDAAPLGSRGPQRGPAGGSGAAAPAGGSAPSVRRGLRLLRRSVGCLCAAVEAHGGAPRPPRDLSPFAAFARLIARLTGDSRGGGSGLLSRSSQGEKASGGLAGNPRWGIGSAPPHGALLVGGPSGLQLSSERPGAVTIATEAGNEPEPTEPSPEKAAAGGRREEERVFEGWDLVERPPLPPPPSRAEDVEHWTRAMFVDATK